MVVHVRQEHKQLAPPGPASAHGATGKLPAEHLAIGTGLRTRSTRDLAHRRPQDRLTCAHGCAVRVEARRRRLGSASGRGAAAIAAAAAPANSTDVIFVSFAIM